jgi:hypothetical protein
MVSKHVRPILYALLVLQSILLTGCYRLPLNSGAPDPSVRAIAFQDDMLWLCRLRRVNLATNTIEDMKPPNYSCDHLLVAQNGWVWAYDKDSLEYYDGQAWHEPKIYDREQGDLNAVTETRDGAIWISSSILTRYEPRTDQATVIVPLQPTPLPKPDPYEGSMISTGTSKGYVGPVFEASDGSLWFNRAFQDIVRWDPTTNSKQPWGANDGFDGFDPEPIEFLQSRDGSIWMGTYRGVYRFQSGKWERMDPSNKGGSQELGDFKVKAMLEDAQGRIWIVYKNVGVMMWDGTQWHDIGNFSHDSPLSLFETSSGEIWIGFLLRGAVKYENGRLKSYPTNILTFFEAPDRRLFGGGGEEGLLLYNRESDRWETYPPSQ